MPVAEQSAREKRHQHLLTLAKQAYEDHVLRSYYTTGPLHAWSISRPGSSIFWQQILMPSKYDIVILGDGPDLNLIVRGGHGCKGVLQKLKWFSESNLGHVTSKVILPKARETFDAEVAVEDVRDYCSDIVDGFIPEYPCQTPQDFLRDILGHIESCSTEHECGEIISERLSEMYPDWWDADFGMVTNSDIYYARAAVGRLVACLDCHHYRPSQEGDPIQ